MKQCLNCQTEFEYKRESAKFCSDRCRVQYNRRHPKNAVTPIQMQEMYNAVMGAVNAINARNGQPEAIGVAFDMPAEKQAVMSYAGAKSSIEASTSEILLEDTWRQIKKQQWAGWQMNELERLKDIQQTKIDF